MVVKLKKVLNFGLTATPSDVRVVSFADNEVRIMKDATFTIEFVSHCLANGRDPKTKCDVFSKDSRGRLIWQTAWWHAAFQRAISEGRIHGIKPTQINVCLVVDAAVEIYHRRIEENWYRDHEAVCPGTKVKLSAVVDDGITETVLLALLERVGKFIGISPWGHHLGYGRFEVIDINVASGVKKQD